MSQNGHYPSYRRTKIICTLGPASGSPAMIRRLVEAGMDAVRLNMAHGSYQEHSRYIQMVRETAKELGKPVAVILDLPGPKVRTGKLEKGKACLKPGAYISLDTVSKPGDEQRVQVNLPSLPRDLKRGDILFLDDGAIKLEVMSTSPQSVGCCVVIGGVLGEDRGLNVPGVTLDVPSVTEADFRHLEFGLSQGVDLVALSFVRKAEDIIRVKDFLRERKAYIPVIAKIEKHEALSNMGEILRAANGVMVARGDLGVEIPLPRVPIVQKDIVRQCRQLAKPVIVATQMLESMVNSSRPTRAEVTDVANAIFDGADALMLSQETSIGKNPGEACSMMAQIAAETENALPYEQFLREGGEGKEWKIEEAISYNACITAERVGAAAIIAYTESGRTAVRVAKHRPRVPILALTTQERVQRRLAIAWGIQSYLISPLLTMEELFKEGVRKAKELGIAQPGSPVVITAGVPNGGPGSTNLLRVEKVL